MKPKEVYLYCPRRPGAPRVAEAVCRACKKSPRCAAWQDFLAPPLFPDWMKGTGGEPFLRRKKGRRVAAPIYGSGEVAFFSDSDGSRC
jgi:hypothetical protein